MFVATSFCRALYKSIYLSSCPATGCSIAMNLEQMVGQTASHLKSAEWLGQSRRTFGAAANSWQRAGIAECSIGAGPGGPARGVPTAKSPAPHAYRCFPFTQTYIFLSIHFQ